MKLFLLAVIVAVCAANTPSSLSVEDPYSAMTPKGGMMTPKGGMMTPKGGMMTPKGGMMTPKGGMMTPKGGSMTPKGGSMTPKGGSMTPKGGSMTPKGGSMNGGMTTPKSTPTTGGAWHGKGVDVSAPCGNWACLKQAGYNYAVVRIFQETGSVDPNGVASVKAAQAAGLATDVYMYPAGTKSTTGKTQAQAVLNALKSVSNVGRVWVDIEGVGKSWTSTSSSNVQLFKDIVSTLAAGGVQIGVYTQGWQWNSIMGSSTAGSAYPVWYAEYGAGPGHYTTTDGTCQYSGSAQSLASFQPFGGWTKAYAKQYNGNCSKCGCSIDANYAP